MAVPQIRREIHVVDSRVVRWRGAALGDDDGLGRVLLTRIEIPLVRELAAEIRAAFSVLEVAGAEEKFGGHFVASSLADSNSSFSRPMTRQCPSHSSRKGVSRISSSGNPEARSTKAISSGVHAVKCP